MRSKITREAVESYLKCKTKAHLHFAEERGISSDYGLLLAERRARVRREAAQRLLSLYQEAEVLRGLMVTPTALMQAAPVILDATIRDEAFSLTFDAMKKAPGESKLGEFHYLPVLCYEGETIRLEQRLLLAVLGVVLGDLQGRQPVSGIMYHGREYRATRVQLNDKLQERARRLLREIRDLSAGGIQPRLMLNAHCPSCEFRGRCRQQAEKEADLSLLNGMGEKEIRKYNRKGIFSVAQLSCTFRLRKRGKRVRHHHQPHYFALQAAAIRDGKVYVLNPPPPPTSTARIYLDIEGNEDRSFVYLVGMLVVVNGRETWHSFWADGTDDEPALFRRVLEVVARFDDFTLVHYGSYETAFIKRMAKASGQKSAVARVLARSINLLSIIHAHVYFPVHSNGLKAIGNYLGCAWTDPEASGLKSIVLRARWETGRDEALRHELETYNREDCMALKRVAELVFRIGEVANREGGATEIEYEGMGVAPAESVNPVTHSPEHGRAMSALPDLNFINKCAYFDYQHEKVFLRTSAVVQKAQSRKEKGNRPRKLPINRTIEVSSRKCPHCGSTSLVRSPKIIHTKLAYDLKVSASGVRRQVIACTAALHRCTACGHSFLPRKYKKRDKHFHSLKGWTMYHHVVHRISFEKLEVMIRDCFGLHVSHVEISIFKMYLARYYRSTYQQILSDLVSGTILHADETHVNFRKGKGYVWALASMGSVAYVYRPTREGDWLQTLLRDFQGVLITDFFTAYDSLHCEQQKCLVHLIRDMNDDLLGNPFDEQFKWLVSEFGLLLRGIVTTIDHYGLRQRHLHKHLAEVDRYFIAVRTREFSSDLASDYSRRLLKNQDKLFTFLKHDGVPWNNNNAEHAIKPFARYRAIADGQMSEPRLRDYLVLLSIYQTCEYRGISFLKFLLSGEKDLDAFKDSTRPRSARPLLQQCPQWYYDYRKGRTRTDGSFFPHG
jgi:predicted RecB family nuclease